MSTDNYLLILLLDIVNIIGRNVKVILNLNELKLNCQEKVISFTDSRILSIFY